MDADSIASAGRKPGVAFEQHEDETRVQSPNTEAAGFSKKGSPQSNGQQHLEKDIGYLFQKMRAHDDDDDYQLDERLSQGSSVAGRFETNDELERFKHFQIILDGWYDVLRPMASSTTTYFKLRQTLRRFSWPTRGYRTYHAF